jgi:hypothetical protein
MASGRKTGGRVKGTPNKLTKEIRVVLKNLIAKEIENLPELLKDLETRERLELLIKLLPYALPKVRDIGYSVGEPLEMDFLGEQFYK